MDPLLKSMTVANSGLRAQSLRMNLIAQNIANADSTARNAEGDPFRRKIVQFEAKFDRELQSNIVELSRVKEDKAPFNLKYDPAHAAADKNGYVKFPNVNTIVETVDMREAVRSYQANLNVIRSSRQMISATLDILRR